MVSVFGDEKGGSKAFSAGDYDASESVTTPDSDGIGWILKGVKAFGETTAAKGIDYKATKMDIDVFALINSLSSPDLVKDQKYKVTVKDEAWDGSDGGDIGLYKVMKGTEVGDISIDGTDSEFIADGTSDYYLQINGEGGQDAQYSVFLDIV